MQLYYGNDPKHLATMRSRFVKRQLVVVEPAGLDGELLSAWQKEVNDLGGKLIGYISIGELHGPKKELFVKHMESYCREHKESCKTYATFKDVMVEENKTFNSYRMDVAAPSWQAFVTAEAKALLARPLDGLFLDTPETADTCNNQTTWPLERRKGCIQAMMDLIRGMKRLRSGAYVMQNRGLNLIGEGIYLVGGGTIPGQHLSVASPDNPDAILWEDAFIRPLDRDWINDRQKVLKAVNDGGTTQVFALGYKEFNQEPVEMCKKSSENGYAGNWALNSISIHSEPTFPCSALVGK